jgi:hypothetical protein
MFSDLASGWFLIFSAMVATGSWLGGTYSVYRGLKSVPAGQSDLPFFSDDPALISDEGRKWRRRVYACMAYFALSFAIILLLYRGH